jgi:NAD(P)H-flavin reductase
LYGIVRDALAQGHSGPVWLFHAAPEPRGLYLMEALMQLAHTFHNFHYARSVLRGDGTGATVGPVEGHILAAIPSLKGWKGYVCGGPAFVNSMKMKLFLAGIASRSIYSDSFIPTAS